MANKFTLSLEVRDMFFDRKKVLDKVRAENRKKLSKAGAFVRRRARSLLGEPVSYRVRSRPGRPARVRSRSAVATLKFILFALNNDWESVVIGPVGLPQYRLRRSTASTVPELLEFGGTAAITESNLGGVWEPGSKGDTTEKRTRRARYEKYPVMGPALDDVVRQGAIADLWSA